MLQKFSARCNGMLTGPNACCESRCTCPVCLGHAHPLGDLFIQDLANRKSAANRTILTVPSSRAVSIGQRTVSSLNLAGRPTFLDKCPSLQVFLPMLCNTSKAWLQESFWVWPWIANFSLALTFFIAYSQQEESKEHNVRNNCPLWILKLGQTVAARNKDFAAWWNMWKSWQGRTERKYAWTCRSGFNIQQKFRLETLVMLMLPYWTPSRRRTEGNFPTGIALDLVRWSKMIAPALIANQVCRSTDAPEMRTLSVSSTWTQICWTSSQGSAILCKARLPSKTHSSPLSIATTSSPVYRLNCRENWDFCRYLGFI